MCDITTVASLIAAASIAVTAAVVLFAIAAINAGTFWGAFANSVLMIAAAVLLGTAIASLGAANAAVSGCANGGCAGPTAILQEAIIAATTGLTVLLAATIVGTVGTSIPWAGVVIAIALVVGGLACSAGLWILGLSISSLDTCLRGLAAARAASPATTSVTIAGVSSMIAGGALLGVGLVLGWWSRGETKPPP